MPQFPRDGVHRAAARLDVGNHPAYHDYREEDDVIPAMLGHSDNELHYSLFDLDVDSIDVTLSLWKWLDGRGLVKDATVKGVRGVIGSWRLNPAMRCTQVDFVL